MDSGLKQRLIGAAVLIALAVIFLPMLVQGPAPDSGVADVPLDMPGAPGGEFQTRDLPLVTPGTAPSGGAVGMAGPIDNPAGTVTARDGAMPTVDAATANQPSPPPAVTGAPRPAAASGDPAIATLPAGPGADAEVATAPLMATAAATQATALPPAAPTPAALPPKPVAIARPATVPPATPPPAVAMPAPVIAKATPPATAAPLPPGTGGGDYAVHFGAYGSAADASAIVGQLRGAQLVARSEAITLDGKPAWRVRIGPYPSRAEAEAARQRATRVRGDVVTRVITLDDPGIPASAVDRAPLRNAATAASSTAPAATSPATAATSTAAAARGSTGAAGVGYAVQVGAFGSSADATALRDRLRSGGFTAFTGTVQTDKGTLTTVRAGPTLDRAAAEALRVQVKSKIGVDGIVRQNP